MGLGFQASDSGFGGFGCIVQIQGVAVEELEVAALGIRERPTDAWKSLSFKFGDERETPIATDRLLCKLLHKPNR